MEKTRKNKAIKGALCCAIGLVLIASGGCQKEGPSEGPLLSSLYGKLEITTPFKKSQEAAQFSNKDKVTFSAKFSRTVDWRIKIEGFQSGASKIISGKSNELNASNAVWMGEASQLPSFDAEKCKVTLFFPGDKTIETDSLVIKSTKIPDGIVLSDFDYLSPSFLIDYSNDGCSIASQSTYPGAHNKFYLNMDGTDKDGDTYLGLLTIPAGSLLPKAPYFPTNTADPDKTYFNVMLYGTGITTTLLTIQFKEDEGALDGKFDGSTEDLYAYQVAIDWAGWKLVSFKYSDPKTTFLTYGGAPGTNGNKIKEPNHILSVDFVLLTATKNLRASTGIDLPLFTLDKPYQP